MSHTVRGAVSRCCGPASSPGDVLLGRTLPMMDTPRRYHCARCRVPVVICRACDRGNLYCFDGCADLARAESQRASAQRYQLTRQGRHNHADRQRRYRQRLQQKVTQQGSPAIGPGDLLRFELGRRQQRADSPVVTTHPSMRCHGCGQHCSPFVRLTVLRGRSSRIRRSPRTSPGSTRRP